MTTSKRARARSGPGPELVRARWSIAALFAVNGVLIGAWAPRIPTISARLHLQPGALGLTLLGVALGNLLAARPAGAACHRFGSARVATVASFGYCGAAVLPALSVDPITLFLALALWGFGMGGQDVAMNAQGVELEAVFGRRVFSSLHAVWSLATFVGALAGGVGAEVHAPVWAQQAIIAAGAVAALTRAVRHLVPDRHLHPDAVEAAADGVGRRVVDLRLLLLGGAAVSSLLAEGVAADWSAIYLRGHLGTAGAWTAAAYAAFCVGMTTGRLSGDRVMDRIGPGRTLLAATVLGGGGLAGGLLASSLPGAVLGFGLAGLGLSVMTPLFFGSAPAPPGPAGRQIAIVTGMGYAGMLLGPSLIGLLAQVSSVADAIWLTPPFIVLAGVFGLSALTRARGRG